MNYLNTFIAVATVEYKLIASKPYVLTQGEGAFSLVSRILVVV